MKLSTNNAVSKHEKFYKFNTYATLIVILIVFGYLTYLSIVVKDIKYPTEHPYLFTIETLLVTLTGSAVIFLMAYGRGEITKVTVYEFLILAAKFGILTLLLQFSGMYSYSLSD